MVIAITCDAAKLPAAGYALNSYSDSAYAPWSWTVDPSRILKIPEGSSGQQGWDFRGIRWAYTPDNRTFTMTWRAGDELRRTVFGPKGVNGIPISKGTFVHPWAIRTLPPG